MDIQVRQTLSGEVTRTTYRLTYVRPNQIMLTAIEPEQHGRAASNRTFFLAGNDFNAYDAIVHERLKREAVPIGSLVERFNSLVGKTDDVLVAFLEPDRLETFLQPFRTAEDWKIRVRRGDTVLSRSSGTGPAANSTEFAFETGSKRLSGMKITIPDGTLDWRIDYGTAPPAIRWQPPQDAPVVPSFTVRPAGPIYATPKAKTLAERSIRAYDRLTHVVFRYSGTMGAGRAWISGGRVKEENSAFVYVWIENNGMIHDKRKGRFYRGRAGLAGMIEYLARAGTRMDPVVRQIAARQNPVLVLLRSGVRVRHIGELSIDGVPGDVLRFQNESAVVTMVLRKVDGLLASVETEIKDETGRPAMITQKMIAYESIGNRVPNSVFQLPMPAGISSAPLSSLPK